jgi:diaminopimelate epimerase
MQEPLKPLPFWKAHAYGNDFLYVPADAVRGLDPPALTRLLCERHTGAGADGVIYFDARGRAATMRLFNTDGSPSEVSGNGVRGLAAILAEQAGLDAGEWVEIETDAGLKVLTLVSQDAGRPVFRADMGRAEDLRQITLEAAGERFEAVALRMGNPQCVILAPELDVARLHRVGPALQRHPAFPDAVNVEIAQVESPARVRILIWERGVGPTESSGTGSCASGVAAAAFGGAARDLEVVAPGGTQRVEWASDGTVYLTGWAEIVLRGEWLGGRPRTPAAR